MKKMFIATGTLLMMLLVLGMFAIASEVARDKKKSKNETKKMEVATPCLSKGDLATCCKKVPYDPGKCKDLKCKHKNGKCDPSACTEHKENELKEDLPCMGGTPCLQVAVRKNNRHIKH